MVLKIEDIGKPKGVKRNRKRKGRGIGSGRGKTSGKATILAITSFQALCVFANHQASGVPTSNNITVVIVASFKVRLIVCQSNSIFEIMMHHIWNLSTNFGIQFGHFAKDTDLLN